MLASKPAMETVPTDRLAKLPPPSSSYTTIERKSFVKISSNNGFPVSKHVENNETFVNHNQVRRIPIHRSVSTTPESPRNIISLHHDFRMPHNLSSQDPFQDFALHHCLRIPSRLSNKSLVDHCSTSSGYDSNSSSNLSNLSGSLPGNRVIRRAPSVSYLYPSTGDSKMQNETSFVSNKAAQRQKRYSFNERTVKDEIINTLDKLEKRIAFFREIAFELFDEKNKLIEALKQVNSTYMHNPMSEVDQQDIQATADGLLYRLNSVDLVIKPMRTSSQKEALEKANRYIDELERTLARNNKSVAKQRCLSYISSCSSENLNDGDQPITVPVDERFQKMVIECALEDQKNIRKKLENLLGTLDKIDNM